MSSSDYQKIKLSKIKLVIDYLKDSIWRWIDGNRLTSNMIHKFALERIRYDKYRKCAYLNIRDNGNVKIELTNCKNERQPYICKYSKNFYIYLF